MIHACCLRVIIVMETYFIILAKMHNLVETVAVRELNWKKLFDKIIT